MDISVKLINLTEEYTSLLDIWKGSFPQDAAFGEFFLKKAAPQIECAAAFVDDQPVSSAFFLPAVLRVDGKEWKARYVYGVGTLPLYRGHGYASQVLNAAPDLIDADVFYLYPATPSLRSFYAKLNYRDFFSHDIKDAALLSATKMLKIHRVMPFDATLYEEKRKSFLEEQAVAYAVFPNAVLQVLLQHFSMIYFDGGVALLLETADTVYLPELLCDAATRDMLFYTLRVQYPSKRIVATVPGTETRSGMVLPISDHAVQYFKSVKNEPFFGTLFDM